MLLSRDATQKKLEHPPPPRSSFAILRPPIVHPKKIKGPSISPPPPPPSLQLKLWLVPNNRVYFLLFTSKWACNWGTCQWGGRGGGGEEAYMREGGVLFWLQLNGPVTGDTYKWGLGGLIRGCLLYLQLEILTIPLTDSVNCESLSGPNIHHASGFPRLYRKHWSTKQ